MRIDLMKEWGKIQKGLSCECCTCTDSLSTDGKCESCINNNGYKNKAKVKKIKMLKMLQEVIDERLEEYEENPMPESFIPKKWGEIYYFIAFNDSSRIDHRQWYGSSEETVLNAKTGNCFRTKEELEKLTLGQKKKLWDKFYKLGE